MGCSRTAGRAATHHRLLRRRRLGLLEPEVDTASDSEAADNPCEAQADLIRTIEGERLQAMVDADMEVVQALHADDFQLVNPGGLALERDEYLDFLASGEVDYLVWEPRSDIEVRLYGDAAVIRYESQIEIIVFGDRSATRNWHTDLYEKRDGQWQVVWSQATAQS
jgi:hypothetical protein